MEDPAGLRPGEGLDSALGAGAGEPERTIGLMCGERDLGNGMGDEPTSRGHTGSVLVGAALDEEPDRRLHRTQQRVDGGGGRREGGRAMVAAGEMGTFVGENRGLFARVEEAQQAAGHQDAAAEAATARSGPRSADPLVDSPQVGRRRSHQSVVRIKAAARAVSQAASRAWKDQKREPGSYNIHVV